LETVCGCGDVLATSQDWRAALSPVLDFRAQMRAKRAILWRDRLAGSVDNPGRQ